MADDDGSGEAAGKLGMFFAVIGGLAGYGANEGGGAIMGAIAGFALGVAVVRAIKYVALLIVAGLGLLFAVSAINSSWKNVQAASTKENGQTSEIIESATSGTTKKVWFRNGCSYPVELYLKWPSPGEGWLTTGPWKVAAGDSKFLGLKGGASVLTTGPNFYFYAHTPDGRLEWSGDESVSFKGMILPMMAAKTKFTEPSYDFSTDCP